MNKLYIAGLASLLLVGSAALAKEVNVEGTLLPRMVTSVYDQCKAQGKDGELSPEFRAVCDSVKEGNYIFSSETLDKAVPNWRLIMQFAG